MHQFYFLPNGDVELMQKHIVCFTFNRQDYSAACQRATMLGYVNEKAWVKPVQDYFLVVSLLIFWLNWNQREDLIRKWSISEVLVVMTKFSYRCIPHEEKFWHSTYTNQSCMAGEVFWWFTCFVSRIAREVWVALMLS